MTAFPTTIGPLTCFNGIVVVLIMSAEHSAEVPSVEMVTSAK